MRRHVAPGTVALAVLGVLTVVLLVLAVQKQNALSSSPTVASAYVPPPPPSVAFLGDGWTSGAPAGGLGPANYTALLAGREGWRVTNTAVYGAGYLAGRPLATQLPRVVEARPQLVVVTAGRADLDETPDSVRAAADRLYSDLRTRLPEARIVAIGPMWLGDDPPRRMGELRDAIRDSAAAAKVPFVDPLADSWFVRRDADGVTPDTANLNDRGHRRLAELVDGELRKVGAVPR